jgi:hypothetical protein
MIPGADCGLVRGLGSRSPLSSRAFTATRKLDPDMDRAAISGRSTSPNAGSKTLVATGAASPAFLLVAVGCTLMMATMMRGMSHGGGHDRS